MSEDNGGLFASGGAKSSKKRKGTDEPQNRRSNTHAPPLFLSREPKSIVTWNADGLASRAKKDVSHLTRMVAVCGKPDIICVQEARLKASNYRGGSKDKDRSTPLPEEVDDVVNSILNADDDATDRGRPFGEYVPVWSLADTRYAGTLTLLRRDLFQNNECGSSDDGGGWREFVRTNAAFSIDGAVDLILGRCKLERDAFEDGLRRPESLSSSFAEKSNDAGKGKGKSKATGKKQAGLSSFFQTKKPSSKTAAAKLLSDHHPEGRFQFFSFPTFDLCQTYVPNNGSTQESFARRRHWDLTMTHFLATRQRILDKSGKHCEQRGLIWCGDLNVARDHRDGTHWETSANGRVVEWFADEQKCRPSVGKNDAAAKGVENEGMPGFTPAERSRFEGTLRDANLIDVWRELHPNGVSTPSPYLNVLGGGGQSDSLSVWERAEWTWRGACGTNDGFRAKYQGKAMRLDYFLMNEFMYRRDAVESCDILGYGERREGLFCGSDHCACLLVLK